MIPLPALPLSVRSVFPINSIYTTIGKPAVLPTTISVKLSDRTTDVANITWGTVDVTTVGCKNILGTLSVPNGKTWKLTTAQQTVSTKVYVGSSIVDVTYNNGSIELKKGDILELTLPECADGGYLWSFKSALDSNILQILDDTYILPSSDPNILGGVGQRRWIIQAVDTGSATINLHEFRLFEANSTINTFNLKITIK